MKKYTLFFAFALVARLGFSQSAALPELSGIIVDVDGEPLFGVTVALKNKNTGTISDVDGRFTLPVSNEDVVNFSYAGAASCAFTRADIESGLHHLIIMEAIRLPECVISARTCQIRSETIICGTVSSVDGCLRRVGEDRPMPEDSAVIKPVLQRNWEYAPNPTRDAVTVKTEKGSGRILLFSGTGAEVAHVEVTDLSTRVDLSRYPSGIYFLYFGDETSVELVGKVVLAKD